MNNHKLAMLGGQPAFTKPLPVGQLYFPDWDDYVEAMRGIFQRQYYTNQGPLVQQLEAELQQRLGVRHVICVANATIGLMMAADALALKGKVITPAYTFIATAQSLTWSGVEPLFCDVDPLTHQIDPTHVERLINDEDVSAVLAVNLWGDVCDQQALLELCERRSIGLYFDSAHAFGCEVQGVPVGGTGELEVFSFHATKVFSAAEGGCLCTNNDELAARLRNIRSSYGAGHPVPVSRTANGRMSEAQAAIALLSLNKFPQILQRNQQLFEVYRTGLSDVPGIHLLQPERVSRTNYQYVVCEVEATIFGLTRDELQRVLHAENVLARRYFSPGVHHCPPYKNAEIQPDLPVTDALCQRTLQLPIGQTLDVYGAERIVDVICQAHHQAQKLAEILRR
ncbi:MULTISPECIES: DegT/DnrJ/EryC1/StrS aminotransferase family protein [Pseudomonas]|uniref:DegT/DnrJ/EryC1/StrS family aminotransferase n=1 Tax=Pseudomonas TaxID=286 RepID=UPI00039EBC58|nr:MULTISPECIES: DegT/DnrJ/EryC1/StrS family aminotransferase [Pseudomonas]MEB3840439.1 aminotransferase class I/II-fold pyridoxal phosphate-dependent enzyme [Pseudomonas guariconensis]MEB3873307.1 aminotransferase class I/II-fold pyridoxal phosphate-dependent enzyme [Pseudomonas guariconensis]MEB3878684.1 aminotransferase class I/II-fold pyridoxal phosphate-dependent enzyme [Pseudomonas guariconensis]MEB3896169.1 aminotransferase class I/II-fold pyridoxal phosphate-dependent enzyme [Pseudomona